MIFETVVGKIWSRWDSVRYARHLGVQVGVRCRFSPNVNFDTEPYLISIGDHVEIASDVRFTTHDGGVWVCRDKHPEWDVIAPIRVGSNVYIGTGAIILPGVSIGDNCIIGAGAIVARDIPNNCVAVGVPAKVIKSVEEYVTALSARAIQTKTMGKNDKKRYLLGRFADYLSARSDSFRQEAALRSHNGKSEG